MSQETIFAVDDDPMSLGTIVNTLEKKGYRVVPYLSGETVLNALGQEQPDLILLDVMMPDTDGFEVCRRLKAEENTREIPVIFMTALTDTVDEVKGLELGAVDYITKPFRIETLLARVRTHLALGNMQKQLQAQNTRLQEGIIERQQAERALEQRNERLMLLNRIGQMFSSSLDLDQVLGTALDEIQRLLDAFSTSFWLHEPETGELHCMHANGPGSEKLLHWRLAVGQGVTGWAFQHNQSVLIQDTWADARHIYDVDKQTGVIVRSMLSIPLRTKGDVIGVLNLVDPRDHHFTQDDLTLLEPIAAEAAIAIEHARLYTLAQHEIAERKQAEQALRESEERYRNLVETSPVPILVHREDRCVFMNREARATLGATTPDDFMEKSIWEIVHPDHHQLRKQRIQKIYDDLRTPPLLEEQFICLDGSVIDVEVMESKTTYMGKLAIQEVFRDITKLKRTEQALRKSQQLLTRLFTSLHEVVFVVDPSKHTILMCNPAVERIFGYQEGEVFGKDIGFFHVDQEMYHLFEADLFNTLDAKETFHAESQMRRKDGSVFISEHTVTEIVDESGERTAVVWVMRDITERKQAEEQLRAAHKEVREKNAQLAELNASKDKLFSIISHDLRSPFSVMLGYFQQIDAHFDRYNKKELKQIIEKLRTSAEKLNTLLENLLTWSRIQRGAMTYSPEVLDLYEVADESIDLFLSKAGQKQIALTNAIAKETRVYADFHMINAIFRNLLSNALKFTSAGGRIQITTGDNETDVEIAVSDTGTGIPPDAIPKLFRLDVQYTNVGTAGEPGTGLGLNLCKDMVEKNGGIITVESEVGQGTTFTFTLPKPSIPQNDR